MTFQIFQHWIYMINHMYKKILMLDTKIKLKKNQKEKNIWNKGKKKNYKKKKFIVL